MGRLLFLIIIFLVSSLNMALGQSFEGGCFSEAHARSRYSTGRVKRYQEPLLAPERIYAYEDYYDENGSKQRLSDLIKWKFDRASQIRDDLFKLHGSCFIIQTIDCNIEAKMEEIMFEHYYGVDPIESYIKFIDRGISCKIAFGLKNNSD